MMKGIIFLLCSVTVTVRASTHVTCNTKSCSRPEQTCYEKAKGPPLCAYQTVGECPSFNCKKQLPCSSARCPTKGCNDEKGDLSCKNREKCCQNCDGCFVCIEPKLPADCDRVVCKKDSGVLCKYQKTLCPRGGSCQDFVASCLGINVNIGTCPKPCTDKSLCNNATSCNESDGRDCLSSGQKCCPTACGYKCVTPETVTTCQGITCPYINSTTRKSCREVTNGDVMAPVCLDEKARPSPCRRDAWCGEQNVYPAVGRDTRKYFVCGKNTPCPGGFECRKNGKKETNYGVCCRLRAPPPPHPAPSPHPSPTTSAPRDKNSYVHYSYELTEVYDGELTGILNETENVLRKVYPDELQHDCEYNRRYRTIDGSCNNLRYPKWGKSFEPQKRYLPAVLVNGTLPRTTNTKGEPLPGARHISTALSPMVNSFDDVSNMVMAWGQFIDHDFTGTPVDKDGINTFQCCGDIADELKFQNGGPCYPIQIPKGDFFGTDCMQFVRSMPYRFPNGTEKSPREQMNTLTSFLDASAVYGNTLEVLDKIKREDGTMIVTDQNMLPENPSGSCKKENKRDYCLHAGDHRVNVFVGLGGLHTLFVREHNRIAAELKRLNPSWNATVIFQETRRIVSAQFQHVTYLSWLPLLLDSMTLNQYRLKDGDYEYNPKINPTVTNVFSTATFRFGHSQVKQNVTIGTHNHQLQDILLRPGYVLHNLTAIFLGLIYAPTERVDRFFAKGLTNHMFETNSTAKNGMDLLSLNIQRGRDHGLPPYNEWREFCGLPRLTSLNSSDLMQDLSVVYSDVDSVDLFIGLILENHLPGARVGPTLACLLGKQFHDLKFGDRFFYETRGAEEGFTEDQLREIKKVSLAKIICDNNQPHIKEILRDVFRLKDNITNPIESCHKLPGIDLNFWKE